MPTPNRFYGVLAKKEATYGTDVVPATTDAVRLVSPGGLWVLPDVRHTFPNRRDDVASSSLIPPKHGVPAGRVVEVTLPWELKGKGSAYSVAASDIEAGPLLEACGMSVALDATGGAEKLTYTPVDTGHASCTLYLYAGGLRYIVTGCRGNPVWPVRAGENGVMMFRLIGMMAANPTTVALPSVTYDASLPPVGKAVAFTINPGASWTPDLMEGTFDLGNEPTVVEDANGADALNEISLNTGRNPQFTCTVRKDALTDYDPSALVAAVTSTALAWTLGATQYNRAKLNITEAYLAGEPKPYDYRGDAGYVLTFDAKALTVVFD